MKLAEIRALGPEAEVYVSNRNDWEAPRVNLLWRSPGYIAIALGTYNSRKTRVKRFVPEDMRTNLWEAERKQVEQSDGWLVSVVDNTKIRCDGGRGKLILASYSKREAEARARRKRFEIAVSQLTELDVLSARGRVEGDGGGCVTLSLEDAEALVRRLERLDR